MASNSLYFQPTLKQLLAAEALSEAQLLFGENLLDQQVLQLVVLPNLTLRPGSLVLAKAGDFGSQDVLTTNKLVGVILIKPLPSTSINIRSASNNSLTSSDAETESLLKLCTKTNTPLIIVPSLGDPAQLIEDIRLTFQAEIKKASVRLHAHFLALVLQTGLQGLLKELAALTGHPVAIESPQFKILAAENMNPTPVTQQRILVEEVTKQLNNKRFSEENSFDLILKNPLRIGRRLVMPLILDNSIVGYLSLMIRPTEDTSVLAEYLAPAALAALVDFSHRRKDSSAFTVTQQSLLKDLLLGRTLSAADQERLEQHFGFDLCDGLLIFAVQVLPDTAASEIFSNSSRWVAVAIEGTHIVVLPYVRKFGKTWYQEAHALLELIKKNKAVLTVQLGAGRLAANILELPDAYREARQALIIGSMIHGDKEFVISYGDLGIRRLLYLMIDHPELDRFLEETLAPLEAYDAEWESELVPTLHVYLQQGANLNSAAKALFIHRHTMRYRLEQIAEILQIDIDSPEVLLNLQIAFLIRELKEKAKT